MLCLQRRLNERVELTLDGHSLGTITVTRIRGEMGRAPSVWLGFEMPRNVIIVRDDAIVRERREDRP